MKLLMAVALAAALVGCDSSPKADGVSPQRVERVTLACQDRAMLKEIVDTKASGNPLTASRLATAAIKDGSCTILQAGDQVVAERGQTLYGHVRVKAGDSGLVYWTNGESLRLI
ncbi:hypothetical protein [Nevskia ramosa]|uniref:hypothetical protein n=1 Tax=Nevskia ramosa TaxID=64002 RepID=UPI002352AA33|nr:hypothetical protein [Nevskia ramosa]